MTAACEIVIQKIDVDIILKEYIKYMSTGLVLKSLQIFYRRSNTVFQLQGTHLVVGPTPLKPHPTSHFFHPTPRGVYPTQLFDSEVGWGVGWGWDFFQSGVGCGVGQPQVS